MRTSMFKTQKVLALVLATLMVFSGMSFTAFAEEETVVVEEVEVETPVDDASEEAPAEDETQAEAAESEEEDVQEASVEEEVAEAPVEEDAAEEVADAEAEDAEVEAEEIEAEANAEEETEAEPEAEEEVVEDEVVLAEVEEETVEVELLEADDYVELLEADDWYVLRTAVDGKVYSNKGAAVSATTDVDEATGYTFSHLVPVNDESTDNWTHLDCYGFPAAVTPDTEGNATFKMLVRTNLTITPCIRYLGGANGATIAMEAYTGDGEWYVYTFTGTPVLNSGSTSFSQVHLMLFGNCHSIPGSAYYTEEYLNEDGETTKAYVDIAAWGFVKSADYVGDDIKTESLTPAATPNLEVSLLSAKGEEDGSVSGLSAEIAYEMRTLDLATYVWGDWEAVAEGAEEITGLAAGAYEIRVAATDTSAASEAFAFEITPDYAAEGFEQVLYASEFAPADGDGSSIANAFQVNPNWAGVVENVGDKNDNNVSWKDFLKLGQTNKKVAFIIVNSIELVSGSSGASDIGNALADGTTITGLTENTKVKFSGYYNYKATESKCVTGGVVCMNMPNANTIVEDLIFTSGKYDWHSPTIETRHKTTTLLNCKNEHSSSGKAYVESHSRGAAVTVIVDSPELNLKPIDGGTDFGAATISGTTPYTTIINNVKSAQIRGTRQSGNVDGYFKAIINGGSGITYRAGANGTGYKSTGYFDLTVNDGTVDQIYVYGEGTGEKIHSGTSVINIKGGNVKAIGAGTTIADMSDETTQNSIIILQGDGLTDANKTAATSSVKATYLVAVEGGETEAVVKCKDAEGNLVDYAYDLRASARVVGITIPEGAEYVTINGAASEKLSEDETAEQEVLTLAVSDFENGYVPVSLLKKAGTLNSVVFSGAPYFNVTWNDGDDSTEDVVVKVLQGSELELPTLEDKEDAVFGGWATESGAKVANVTADTEITGDVVFYAVYKPILTVTYKIGDYVVGTAETVYGENAPAFDGYVRIEEGYAAKDTYSWAADAFTTPITDNTVITAETGDITPWPVLTRKFDFAIMDNGEKLMKADMTGFTNNSHRTGARGTDLGEVYFLGYTAKKFLPGVNPNAGKEYYPASAYTKGDDGKYTLNEGATKNVAANLYDAVNNTTIGAADDFLFEGWGTVPKNNSVDGTTTTDYNLYDNITVKY